MASFFKVNSESKEMKTAWLVQYEKCIVSAISKKNSCKWISEEIARRLLYCDNFERDVVFITECFFVFVFRIYKIEH